MRIATWNINSVTARLDRLTEWLESAQPDVVALQELKCTTEAFPAMPIQALGYESVAHGNGRWNGVAILSRVGLEDVTLDLDEQPEFDGVVETRAVGATCGGVRVWSVYVPNGREPDHPHYSYKLDWFGALRNTVRRELSSDPALPYAVIGDYNVAPTDDDVWDIALFADSTHVTQPERDALAALRNEGLADVPPRALKGEPYTFWDYRNGAFHRGWGMRIDLVYANPAFVDRVSDAWIDREARKGKGASDHAPVVVDLSDAP
ncbi:MAG: exodeoxyribonuclease III [Actinomycetales bacterium]|nr:exodeoxyribonuclease III [Actinomycetales bacterium]